MLPFIDSSPCDGVPVNERDALMKTYTHRTTTPVPAARLYDAITDINRWSDWDDGLDWARHESSLAPGAAFRLKPAGAPEVSMEITEASRPGRFADIAHLHFAKLHTSHVFRETDGRTEVETVISISGLLGFFWDRVFVRKHAAEAAAQTQKLIAFAAGRP
jgi:uncharacterized protein YndB with AHSA1/START domain